MGRILFIRVSADSYDEEAVPRAWPRLCALAWPNEGDRFAPQARQEEAGKSPRRERGVLALVDTLVEQARFADAGEPALPEKMAQRLEHLRERLDAALGDRDVPTAHGLTNELEDALDDAEKMIG